MRKWLAGAFVFLVLAAAWIVPRSQASITCTLPFTLQNNTTADATQVMANYNALVTCFLSAAAAGVNSDITALTALTTPLTPAQGGSALYYGGTSTGTANAQVLASPVPIGFTLSAGKSVVFVAGSSNTAATTLNINSTGAANVFRRTQIGVSALVGGEIVAGQIVQVTYDGTQYQLANQVLVGEGRDWFTTSAPAGWLFRDGSSLLRTDYPVLFSVIGTTYGAVDGTHFSLPDEQGRMGVMKDGAARITGVCAAANTLGTVCGNTAGTVAFAQANLPAVSFTVSGTDPTYAMSSTIYQNMSKTTPATDKALTTETGGGYSSASPLSITKTGAGSYTAASGGSGTALTVLNGSLVVNKIIKY